MNNKREFKEIKQKVETICKVCDTFDESVEALKLYFTEVTDCDSPRADEFNKKYSIIEIFNSKEKRGIRRKYKDGTMLIVDYYLYDKAPNGVLFFLNQMERLECGWFQCGIAGFIKENNN